jgi:hypothetical protein
LFINGQLGFCKQWPWSGKTVSAVRNNTNKPTLGRQQKIFIYLLLPFLFLLLLPLIMKDTESTRDSENWGCLKERS